MPPSLLALKGATFETVNRQTIEEMIEHARNDEQFEHKLLDAFRSEVEKEPPDQLLLWVILILGHAQSEKAVQPLMECFQEEMGFFLLECVQHALAHIGEPAIRAVHERFKETEPNSEEKIGLYYLLENVCEMNDEELRRDTVELLKKRIQKERSLSGQNQVLALPVQSLASFREDGDPDFVLKTLNEVPSNPETRSAKEILEGEVDYSDQRDINRSWEEMARKITD